MLILVFGIVVFFWLTVGAIQYLVCIATPRLRRYALSAALWWAMWGPCSVALMTLAGLALVADAFITKDHDASSLHVPHLLATFGWSYLVFGVIGTVVVATGVAWLHQALAHRLTFSLFRLYVTAVSAGIGSVFGWCFSWWILAEEIRHGWILGAAGMLILIVGFGLAAYRGARGLRGDPPKSFAWASQAEFEGA